MNRIGYILLALAMAPLALLSQARFSNAGAVVNTKHNFAVTNTTYSGYDTANQHYIASGPEALPQNAVCVFCHTPHNASSAGPLWNHGLSGSTYTLYTSSTLSGVSVRAPEGNTKLCLSCHDGSVALGSIIDYAGVGTSNSPYGQVSMNTYTGSPYLPSTAGQNYVPPRSGNLGVNLASDHPISFNFPSVTLPALPQVQAPTCPSTTNICLETVGANTNTMQCTTCHDPHNEFIDPTEGRFLRTSNSGAAICTSCHMLQGSGNGGSTNSWTFNGGTNPSSHGSGKGSGDSYTNSQNDGGLSNLGAHMGAAYNTVALNGCESCHRPHNANIAPRLLKGSGATSSGSATVCFQCHVANNGSNIKNPGNSTANQDIQYVFASKTYKHPGSTVDGSSGANDNGHDPNETIPINANRHAACDDCHNPHAAQSYEPSIGVFNPPPVLPSSLWGVTGVSVTASGSIPLSRAAGNQDAIEEYQICLKCHGDPSSNQPQTTVDNGSVYGNLGGSPLNYGYLPKHLWDYQTSSNPSNVNWGNPPAGAQTNRANLREKFTDHATYPSYHPVVDARNLPLSQVPSLRPYKVVLGTTTPITTRPLDPSSKIYCTDCHDSDTSRNTSSTRLVTSTTGAFGPAGPHGSDNSHLLVGRVEVYQAGCGSTGTGTQTGGSGGCGFLGLCSQCHDMTKHLFNLAQNDHYQKCTTCHDPHASKNAYLHGWDGGCNDGDTSGNGCGAASSGGTAGFVSPYNDQITFTKFYGVAGCTCVLSCHAGPGYSHNTTTCP